MKTTSINNSSIYKSNFSVFINTQIIKINPNHLLTLWSKETRLIALFHRWTNFVSDNWCFLLRKHFKTNKSTWADQIHMSRFNSPIMRRIPILNFQRILQLSGEGQKEEEEKEEEEEEGWHAVTRGRKDKLQGVNPTRRDKTIPVSRPPTIINAIIAFNCREWQDHPSCPPPSCFYPVSPSLYDRSALPEGGNAKWRLIPSGAAI